MRFRARRAGLLALVLLCGCQTREDFEAKLNSWVGEPESALVASWGPPVRFFETGGDRYLTYSESRTAYYPGFPPSYSTTTLGSTTYSEPVGGIPPSVVNLSCEITFTSREGRIYTWRWKGNNCY